MKKLTLTILLVMIFIFLEFKINLFSLYLKPIANIISDLTLIILFITTLIFFKEPIEKLLLSLNEGKFSLKIGDFQLNSNEGYEQLKRAVDDLTQQFLEIKNKNHDEYKKADKNIIWVDDKPQNNAFIIEKLTQLGFKITSAIDTEEAFEKIRSEAFDIVISDIDRPSSNIAGVELSKRLREEKYTMPIYIFCGSWYVDNKSDDIKPYINGITSSGIELMEMIRAS